MISTRKLVAWFGDLTVLALAFYFAFEFNPVKSDFSLHVKISLALVLTPAVLFICGYIVSRRYLDLFGLSPVSLNLKERTVGAIREIDKGRVIEKKSESIKNWQEETKARIRYIPQTLLNGIVKAPKYSVLSAIKLIKFSAPSAIKLIKFSVKFILHFIAWCIPAYVFLIIIATMTPETGYGIAWRFAVATFLIMVALIVAICALLSIAGLERYKRHNAETEKGAGKGVLAIRIYFGFILIFLFFALWSLNILNVA